MTKTKNLERKNAQVEYGKNQCYLRRKNKQAILSLLKERDQSYSDLARALKLSNTAIGKIVEDLINQGIVIRSGDVKGRSGIKLSINEDYGYVVVIDLSATYLTYCVANFKSEIIYKKDICELVVFSQDDLNNLIESIKQVTQSELLKDKKLCCISIASPGKIDKKTGKFVLNPRFRDFIGVSLQKIFKQEFSCSVIVKNDMHLALEGEKIYGNILNEVSNAIMLHIDIGTGSAIMIDDKVYEGSNGFAGEIGYYKLNMQLNDDNHYSNLTYSNYYDSLSLYSILAVIKREVLQKNDTILRELMIKEGKTPDEITIKMMIDAYNMGDQMVIDAVNSSGCIIGEVVGNLAEWLDVELIIINGSVINLGNKYLDNIAKYTHKIKVAYSDLGDNACKMGALNLAILKAFEEFCI